MSYVTVLGLMFDRKPIFHWLAQNGLTATRLANLPGDVSLRRYMRAQLDRDSLIVAAYPPEMRSACRRYLDTTDLLTTVGVRVPRIVAHDCALGLMALEDVGSQTLYDLPDLDEPTLAGYFRHSGDNLERIQSLPRERVATLNPPLDEILLGRELQKTWKTFLEPLGIEPGESFGRDLHECLEALCHNLGAEDLVPCHRDYMVRNLIPLEPYPSLVVIDHQDLRLGPRYYDLASLLNDSLFPSPLIEEEILSTHLERGPAEKVLYHRAAAQRTLKAVGTYAAFAQRGFQRHRKLIPPTLHRAFHHLAHVPETGGVAAMLESCLRAEGIC
jgi:aminoglycoside/choline kinase family phosphotransferase